MAYEPKCVLGQDDLDSEQGLCQAVQDHHRMNRQDLPGVVEAAAMPATDMEGVVRRVGFVVATGSGPEEAASNAENAVSAIVLPADKQVMDNPPYTHGKVLKH